MKLLYVSSTWKTGVYSTQVYTGRLRPRSKNLTLSNTTKKIPLTYIFHWKKYLFQYYGRTSGITQNRWNPYPLISPEPEKDTPLVRDLPIWVTEGSTPRVWNELSQSWQRRTIAACSQMYAWQKQADRNLGLFLLCRTIDHSVYPLASWPSVVFLKFSSRGIP